MISQMDAGELREYLARQVAAGKATREVANEAVARIARLTGMKRRDVREQAFEDAAIIQSENQGG